MHRRLDATRTSTTSTAPSSPANAATESSRASRPSGSRVAGLCRSSSPPRDVQFFNKHWTPIGDKRSHASHLERLTHVPVRILRNSIFSHRPSVTQIMSWAADRVMTREEDWAYSLLRLFDMYLPMLYGEGRHIPLSTPGDHSDAQRPQHLCLGRRWENQVVWQRPCRRSKFLLPLPRHRQVYQSLGAGRRRRPLGFD